MLETLPSNEWTLEAAAHLLNRAAFGGNVKPGLYGQTPSLTDLDGRDLKHNIDFRSVYATLLSKWVGANPETILHGKFPQLDFI